MGADTTSLAIYCAPDAETFSATCKDLAEQSTVLFEASNCIDGQEIPFVLCGSLNEPTVLFGSALDRDYSQDDLQDLAQNVIEFYMQELAKSNPPKSASSDACDCDGISCGDCNCGGGC